MRYFLLATLLLILSVPSAHGQTPWLQADRSNLISVEWQKPNFAPTSFRPSDDRISFFSSVLFLNGKYAVNEDMNLVVELPFSHWEYIDPTGPDAQAPHTTIGNVYVGNEFLFQDNNTENITYMAELGIRLPTLARPDFPDNRGAFTGNIVSKDRREAFLYDYLPVSMFGNLLYSAASNLTFRLRAGGVYAFYTGDSGFQQNRKYLLYGAQTKFTTPVVHSKIRVTARTELGRQNAISRGTDTELWIQFEKPFQNWMPGLYLRTPLDEPNSIVTYVWGVEATLYL
jgi:hypothetical protein